MKHQEIKQLLPEVFQRTDHKGSPLSALLKVMESMTEPAEEVLQQIPGYFNPYTTPERFLPLLARWVDLDRFFPSFHNQTIADNNVFQSLGSGRLRELIISASTFSKLRGTAKGLQLFLETASGEKGFKIDENVLSENGEAIPFHIQVTAPESTKKHETLIERIIEQEKPAYVTYNLKFSS